MFEQHPVPQQISSYQFRLVGDMTIKQFFQIAAGGVIALIIYGMPFPGFIKWPLIVIAALSGAAFAFLPIQDRPLEQWLFAFIRSIYSPTYFVWQKKDTPPQYFQASDASFATQAVVPLTPEQEHAQDMKEIKQSTPTESQIPDFIASDLPIDQNSQNIEPQQQTQQVMVDSSLKQEIDSLKDGRVLTDSSIKQDVEEKKEELVIPTQQAVQVEKKGFSEPEQPVYVSPQMVQSAAVDQVLTTNQNTEEDQEIKQAQFSPDAAPPLPPELPNIIKGQVMDREGHIIDGAILEIKDVEGRPVRALRSNNAGHFQIVTTLPNGSYKIMIDKEGFEFDPLSIELKGELVNPIAIRAK